MAACHVYRYEGAESDGSNGRGGMGLHDRLARKAITDGHGREHFHHAAQKHANATWVMLIAALAVWYFVGWQWALIPAILGAYTALSSISSTMVASRLETADSPPPMKKSWPS